MIPNQQLSSLNGFMQKEERQRVKSCGILPTRGLGNDIIPQTKTKWNWLQRKEDNHTELVQKETVVNSIESHLEVKEHKDGCTTSILSLP